MIKRALIFVASMTAFAGIAWVSGYDFDRRGYDVGALLCFSLLLSFVVSIFPYQHLFSDD